MHVIARTLTTEIRQPRDTTSSQISSSRIIFSCLDLYSCRRCCALRKSRHFRAESDCTAERHNEGDNLRPDEGACLLSGSNCIDFLIHTSLAEGSQKSDRSASASSSPSSKAVSCSAAKSAYSSYASSDGKVTTKLTSVPAVCSHDPSCVHRWRTISSASLRRHATRRARSCSRHFAMSVTYPSRAKHFCKVTSRVDAASHQPSQGPPSSASVHKQSSSS